MNKKFGIFLSVLIILCIISYIAIEDFFYPLKIILFFVIASIVGIPMAIEYPWDLATHQVIILVSSSISFLMMLYGAIRKKTKLGVISFVVGYIAWSVVGLVYGLGTGT